MFINKNAVSVENSAKSRQITFEDLSYNQRQKYNYLHPIFKDETAILVSLLEGRGRNSWISINDKVASLNSARHNEQIYHDTLYDNFELNKVYSSADIIGIVADVRREIGLTPYITRLKLNCENDFFSLFIVKDVYEEVTDGSNVHSKHVGFTPIFKLKVED